ncbi:MAG TPA: STAS domain-containing protein [Acidobacteriaceae bacterium]|nr:STAS domain-containing protein [Acidobacteriaceae bacterium]
MQASTKVAERTATGGSGDPVAILAFTGDISSTSKDTILDSYKGLGATAAKVLLDFRGVDYINSSGIAIIIQLLLEANKAGHRTIGIFGLTPHFNKVFTMVGVAKYATISPDEATALGKL